MASWTFHSAGTLHVGRGALDRLPAVLAGLGATRLFVATDAVLEKVGIVDRVLKALAAGTTPLTNCSEVAFSYNSRSI